MNTRGHILYPRDYICSSTKEQSHTDSNFESDSSLAEKPLLVTMYHNKPRIVLCRDKDIGLSPDRYLVGDHLVTDTSSFSCKEGSKFDDIYSYLSTVLSPYNTILYHKNNNLDRHVISGGFIAGKPTSSTVLIDSRSLLIETLPPLPLSLVGHSFLKLPIQCGADYVLFGGLTGDDIQMNTRAFLKEGVEGDWREETRTPHICPPRAFHASCGNSNHIFVHGGLTRTDLESVTNQLWHYDGNEWECLHSFRSSPPYLYRHSCTLTSGVYGRLCLFGGFNRDHSPNNIIYTFDLFSSSWMLIGTTGKKNAEVVDVREWGKEMYVLQEEQKTWRILKTKMKFPYLTTLNQFEITDVTINSTITSSVFSTVYDATYQGKHVVLKRYIHPDKSTTNDEDWADFLNDFYREMSSPPLKHSSLNIRVPIGACGSPDMSMMFEYKTPLLDHISSSPLSQHDVFRLSLELAQVMVDISRLKLIHGDIKAQNCLLDENGTLFLSDFGLLQSCFAKKERFYSFHGAPELWKFQRRKYDLGYDLRKADVYAFGFTVWQFLTNCQENYPFALETIEKDVQDGLRPKIPPCSKVLEVLIETCWHADYNARPNFEEIVIFLQSNEAERNK